MSERKISGILRTLINHLITYAKNYLKYLGYEAFEKSVKVTSNIISNFIVVVIAGLSLNVMMITLAFYVGYVYDAIAEALLFIAGLYFVLALLFIIFRKSLIKRPIQKQIIQFVFDPEPDDHKESKS